MLYSTLLFDKSEFVATITLNRPDKSNAFNDTMVAEFIDALNKIDQDHEVRAIVITGAGKNFSAGQDLAPMLARYQSPDGVSFGEHLRKSYNLIIAKIRGIEKPFLAAVNGAAAGAGFGLACACDMRHAAENSKFRMAFIGIALAPDSGTSFFLPRLVGLGRASEMAFTNELIDAERALQFGLVNRVFKPEELLAKTRTFAIQLAQMPTKSIGLTKRAINRALTVDLETALEYEATLQEIAGHTADHIEGVKAFVEKRPPKFVGK